MHEVYYCVRFFVHAHNAVQFSTEQPTGAAVLSEWAEAVQSAWNTHDGVNRQARENKRGKTSASSIQCNTVQRRTVQYSKVQHDTVQYSTVTGRARQGSMIQYSVV